jgi:hypothetical protein
LLEQAQEMVWSAADRNGRDTLGVWECCVGQQLFRGQSKQ